MRSGTRLGELHDFSGSHCCRVDRRSANLYLGTEMACRLETKVGQIAPHLLAYQAIMLDGSTFALDPFCSRPSDCSCQYGLWWRP